jgi:ABC-type uncharacterized transport system fused permease/ATPase subunit
MCTGFAPPKLGKQNPGFDAEIFFLSRRSAVKRSTLKRLIFVPVELANSDQKICGHFISIKLPPYRRHFESA